MRRRFLIAIMVAAVIATIGCTALRPFAPSTQSVDWQELTNQWGAWATSSGPSVGTQLFQSETDVETWTKQYGQRIPTEGVDFSKDTVVVIVRDIPHAAPVVRAVILDGGKLRIKLTSRLVGAPSIPPGAEMRRFVALRLPKVDVLPVDEEVE